VNEIMERLIFDDLILENKRKEINLKVKNEMNDFCNDIDIISEVTLLKDTFKNKKECLIHNDLHTSNIFVDYNEMRVFDTEFASYGPISFDIGRLIGNIILNYASLIGMDDISLEEKEDYQEYLIHMINDILIHLKKNLAS
jgi:5-methylthioribose kinase